MRLGWHVRKERGTRIAASIVASLLTLGVVTLLSGTYKASTAALRGSLVRGAVRAYERIVFVVPARARSARRVAASSPIPVAPPVPVMPDSPVSPGTVARTTPDTAIGPRAVSPTLSRDSARPARRSGPAPHPVAFTLPPRPLTAEQRDSMLGALTAGDFARRAMRLKPTQAQKDSIERERARIYAQARADGRPVPIPFGRSGAGGSIGVPLFSRGRSREQRRRDSIVHQDNIARLQRLAARAQARIAMDSTRRADSIASLKVIAVDSMDE